MEGKARMQAINQSALVSQTFHRRAIFSSSLFLLLFEFIYKMLFPRIETLSPKGFTPYRGRHQDPHLSWNGLNSMASSHETPIHSLQPQSLATVPLDTSPIKSSRRTCENHFGWMSCSYGLLCIVRTRQCRVKRLLIVQ